MNSGKALLWISALFLTSCSDLSTLTRHDLSVARDKWTASRLTSYTMVVRMEGDRVERSDYEVHVDQGVVTDLKRNGKDVSPAQGQGYSMDGLFGIIEDELSLGAKDPTKLGVPEGYMAYFMAAFDSETGRLLKYRRSVGGGASNSIDIVVQSFEPQR